MVVLEAQFRFTKKPSPSRLEQLLFLSDIHESWPDFKAFLPSESNFEFSFLKFSFNSLSASW